MRPSRHAIVIRSRPSGNTALVTTRSKLVRGQSPVTSCRTGDPGVPEAGNDVPVLVQAAVDGRRIHRDLRMMRVEVLEALRTRQETDELDGARSRLLEALHRATAELPVASIGSTTMASRSLISRGTLK